MIRLLSVLHQTLYLLLSTSIPMNTRLCQQIYYVPRVSAQASPSDVSDLVKTDVDLRVRRDQRPRRQARCQATSKSCARRRDDVAFVLELVDRDAGG